VIPAGVMDPARRGLRLLRNRRRPSKSELKDRQWEACREYLAAHAEVAAGFPVAKAVDRAKTTGGREVAPGSRTVDLLRTRFARTIEFLRAHVPDAFDERAAVLDAGAADAVYLRALGKDGIALNVDEAAVDRVRGDGVKAVSGSVHDVPFEDRAFDAVLCLEVIEHLENPIGAMRELARISTGPLVVTIPHMSATRVRPFGDWAGDERLTPAELRARSHFHHVFEFSLEDFANVAGHAGWRVTASERLIPFEPMPKWRLVALEHAEGG
jgi:SAM-dependent methyltransferase